MPNRKKILKEQLKDLPYSLGAASLAMLFSIGQGIFKAGEGILEAKSRRMGVGGAFDWGMKNSGDFVSDYLEIKQALKNLTENNSRVILYRLQKKGLVERSKKDYKLTSLGLKYFKKIKQSNDENKKKWDGKWRIASFDIPEKIKQEREWMRSKLFEAEYKMLQKSVFIGKRPLSEKLYKEILAKKLRDYIRMITVGEIDDENIFSKFDSAGR
jgi:DNA-binding PadR family transcriptional regulator